MDRPISETRGRAGAGAGLLLLLLVGVGLLAWRTLSRHPGALAAVQVKLDERTRERDLLARELAVERQRLRTLEQVWSAKLELARSARMAADQKLRECEARQAGFFSEPLHSVPPSPYQAP